MADDSSLRHALVNSTRELILVGIGDTKCWKLNLCYPDSTVIRLVGFIENYRLTLCVVPDGSGFLQCTHMCYDPEAFESIMTRSRGAQSLVLGEGNERG